MATVKMGNLIGATVVTEKEMLSQLQSRCAAMGLSMEDTTEYTEGEDGTPQSMNPGWRIFSTDGEFKGSVYFWLPHVVKFVHSTSFEYFRPIEGYEAMWSPNRKVIEAAIFLNPLMLSGDHAFTEVLRRLEPSSFSGVDLRHLEIRFPSELGEPRITLRFASAELLIWRTADPTTGDSIEDDTLIPCLRIEGLAPKSEDEAKELLEYFGNGALLGLEHQTSVAARLQTPRPFMIRFTESQPKVALRRVASAPETVPTSLYMHARLETGNLAAMFLGFYCYRAGLLMKM